MLDARLLAAVRGHVVQVDTLRDLQDGHFDAVTTVGAALSGCTVGLGVAEAADGEIVAVDGEVWRVPADGVPRVAPAELGLPFAIAARGGRGVPLPVAAGSSMDDLGATIDELLGEVDSSVPAVIAVRIDGTFTDVLLRSEPRQSKPYRLLSDVLDHEVRFAFDEWRGSLVGFRFIGMHEGDTVPGLHLHAISADRRSGGHCHRATVRAAEMTAWLDDVELVGH